MKLGDYIIQVRGVSYKPTDIKDSKYGTPILRANNIFDEEINFNDLIYIDDLKIKKNQYLQDGDILICTSSGSKNLVGKAGLFFEYKTPVSFGAFCKILRIKDNNNIDKSFIKLFFQSKLYRKQISHISKGANINNIKTEDIDNLRIAIPSLEIQEKAVLICSKIVKSLKIKKNELILLDELIKSRFMRRVVTV